MELACLDEREGEGVEKGMVMVVVTDTYRQTHREERRGNERNIFMQDKEKKKKSQFCFFFY